MHFDGNGISVATTVVPWTYLAGSAAAATVLLLLSKTVFATAPTHKNGVPLPPGPPATWFWENPFPEKHIAHRITALIEKYGPIMTLRRGSNVIVIIGRMDAASEIMEKEGGVLFDRPHLISVSDMLSEGMRFVLQPAGKRFRRFRRAAHTHLQPKAAQMYEELQEETAKEVILDVLNDPKGHMTHIQRYAFAVILRVTYGKTSPTSTSDPEVVRGRQVLENFVIAMRPGGYLVDRMPWLKHVPGYGRELKEFHRYELALFRDQLDRVRNDMANGNAGPSFAKMLLEDTDDHRLSEDELSYLTGALFGAGSDTTASVISVMIIAAACYPDAQARVQAELDDVVGQDRAPTFEDWDMLPQLHAFMLEAMRWRPTAPLGFEHRAMKDIIWRGFCIPEGATVVGSHWAISRDPVAFPDPETFKPERWLTEAGRVRTDMHFFAYGFGRRVCPGRYVASRSFYINLALLLWSFRISQRSDKPINLGPGSFEDVILYHHEPFEVNFVPRIEEKRLRELMA